MFFKLDYCALNYFVICIIKFFLNLLFVNKGGFLSIIIVYKNIYIKKFPLSLTNLKKINNFNYFFLEIDQSKLKKYINILPHHIDTKGSLPKYHIYYVRCSVKIFRCRTQNLRHYNNPKDWNIIINRFKDFFRI